VAAAAGEGSDLFIRSHPSFSEATVWAGFWVDYFVRLDVSFSPAYALLAKLWGREALRTAGKILTDIADMSVRI